MIPGEIARYWLERGVQPIPVPYKSKSPNLPGWPNLRLTVDDLLAYFDGGPQNVGLLLGAPSGGIADVDIDSTEARKAWLYFAPQTDLVWGRPSNPSSHWIYRVTPHAPIKKWRDPTLNGETSMLVELRSTRQHSLSPFSTHPLGEQYGFERNGHPSEIDEDSLVRSIAWAAAAALIGRHWPVGSRHDAALFLTGGLALGGVPIEVAETFIRAVAAVADDDEVDDRIRALTDSYGRASTGQDVKGWGGLADCMDPRVVNAVRSWLGLRATGSQRAGDLGMTDLGNAERMLRVHGQDLRYCHASGSWFTWDGRRWRKTSREAIRGWAIAVVRSIYREAADPSLSDSDRRALGNWAVRSKFEQRINALVSLATALPELAIEPDDFDTDPFLLNAMNGTVDLRTGELRPHDRDDLITKLVPAQFDPDATCPRWEAFLERVQPDIEMRRFLRRAVGYSATGSTRERVMFMPFGTGANGKSTFLDTLAEVLGDYAQQVPSQTLLARRSQGVNNDIARLAGVRFATAVETDEGKRFAEAEIKQLTGDRRVTARYLHKEFFEFRPQMKLWLATNHKPLVRGADKGIWDRLKLIDFPVRIPEQEWDRTLDETLREEQSGILAWVIRGCLEWQEQGLGIPESVRAATEAYRNDMDVVGTFLDETCNVDPDRLALSDVLDSDFMELGPALYRAYFGWCRDTGEYPVSRKAFGQRLEERGFQSKRRTGNQKYWFGLRLRPTEAGFIFDLPATPD
jgi:putative DNA primase/helicase